MLTRIAPCLVLLACTHDVPASTRLAVLEIELAADAGDVVVGEEAVLPLRLVDAGDGEPFEVVDVSVTGDTDHFDVTHDWELPLELAVGDSLLAELHFHPTAEGDFEAVVEVVNTGRLPLTASTVVGSGVAAP